MSANSPVSDVRAFELARDRIPPLLKALDRWVTWHAGLLKPNGKFDKVPIDAQTGAAVSANKPSNWLSFSDACAAYDRGACDGIGIALATEPVTRAEGTPLYLVAVDLDNCADRIAEVKQRWLELGKPYKEVSPSGNGVRMLALSRVPIRGGNDGNGHELYGSGRFVTVTGVSGGGGVIDATEALLQLQAKWFPPKPPRQSVNALTASLAHPPRPESSDAIERVKTQLAHVSADCSYEQWRNIVWSVVSTGWQAAEALAREWSQSAPDRFDENAFDQLVRGFDRAGGIGLGTLDHHARKGGWLPTVVAQTAAVHPLQSIDGAEERSGLLTRDDLQALPPMDWRVRGVLPARGVVAIYGQSGSGKTFLALDLACSIAAGVPQWFGAKVKPAPVVYVALEGQAGIRARVTAWELQHRQHAPDTARFVLGNFTLIRSADSDALAADIIEQLGPGAVVVVDTLNQSAPGVDENSSADIGLVIANAKALADAIKGAVVLVHHAGKDASRGMRGHSSLFAAMDAVIEVSVGPNGRSWRLSKSKDGESGTMRGFELFPYVVGQAEDGTDIRSCAVRPVLLGTARPTKPVSGRNQKAALKVLAELSADHPDSIPLKDAVLAVGAALECPDGRRAARAAEAIKTLTESGHLLQTEGGIALS
jgi:hypothetical protein